MDRVQKDLREYFYREMTVFVTRRRLIDFVTRQQMIAFAMGHMGHRLMAFEESGQDEGGYAIAWVRVARVEVRRIEVRIHGEWSI